MQSNKLFPPAFNGQPTNKQPKKLTHQELLKSLGHPNLHSFMKSHGLRFSAADHYAQAQTILEQHRYNLQRKWEWEHGVSGINGGFKRQIEGEEKLKELGFIFGGGSMQKVEIDPDEFLSEKQLRRKREEEHFQKVMRNLAQ